MMIISLTTDFGAQDYYQGALKGALLRHCPSAVLVDISHAIEPFNIVHGAFVLSQAWPSFPDGAIHMLAVNCAYDAHFRFLAARHQGSYFLAPDNGILSLMFDDLPESDLRNLGAGEAGNFPVQTAFAAAAAHLCSGQAFETLGEAAGGMLQRIGIRPVILRDRIRGTVIHIDHFGNVVLNIPKRIFEQVGGGRPFSLYFKRNDAISKISTHYCDVPVGEPLCLFNSAGLLEIAINLGRASGLLGLKVEDVVEVDFAVA